MRPAATALLVATIALAGCGDSLNQRVARADLVRICRDGTWIGRDPKSGGLVAVRSWLSADIQAGLTADQVCLGGARAAAGGPITKAKDE